MSSDEGPSSGSLNRRGEGRSRRPWWIDSPLILGAALAIAVIVKSLFLQAFYIPSQSMEPGLRVDDRIVVEKPSHWFGGQPERGEIVVFKDPGGWLSGSQTADEGWSAWLTKLGLQPAGGHLIKRVIGVPGDTIECCDSDGHVIINGQSLDEGEYITPQGDCDAPQARVCAWTAGPVPDGYVFVMGDNRDNSADSVARLCLTQDTQCSTGDAYVPIDNIVGTARWIVWPPSRAGNLDAPDIVTESD